ncbi:nicotinamide mononucleotide transporter [Lachnospiraceae bacterium]|uniref:nicotinamide riboside transporter PnuC n=1 Tax=Extibacter sp. GGCC_0201 TaxID=2731209 RepID=UPI001AA0B76C|nr:nicotinamide riboside transporter PnuC [Extibacter sp. GGCC_0201]MBO1722670.1 nicotinamide mononucleotide transporter [Extibacter sp. GGCC_0201]BDF34870.1 nicotinamide mononucleotide transporter [Lachnospiraceae bacterium]BDF38871.1 nicotinamide mononucleotide transporter [Lachnospiraceae bacterium]
MEKTKRFFTDWSRFEIIWLILSTVIMIVLSIIWGDNLLALISGITGILGVVLAAKGKVSTYIFATVNVAIYALLTFQNHLYGEFMLNAFYYIPMNFIGFYLWSKHKDNESGEVEGKKLTGRQTVILFAAVAVVVLVYWQILSRIGGQLALIDAMSTIFSVVALIMQVARYAEQWLLWIIVNVVSVVMWLLLIGKDSSAITMVVMWVAYLFNSVYGYYNWRKLAAKNVENK